MYRVLKWLLVLAVLGGVAWGVAVPGMTWWRKRSEPRYLTVKTSRGAVESVVNSTGTIKPVRSVLVGAFVSGPIKDVFIDFNSPVKEWELMATIDDRLHNAAVERDEATLKTQKAELNRVKA